MKRLLYFLPFLWGMLFAACGEDRIPTEYDNWPSRNAAAFADTLQMAETAIAKAKAEHGAQWQEHCPWRVVATYALAPEAVPTTNQKIVLRKLAPGSGSGTPLYTDTVRVNYIGRLMPTPEHPQGLVFDHSGASSQEAQVFHPTYSHPQQMAVNRVTEGFSTALQQLHIGERWRLFIPSPLGYGAAANASIPAHSMLIFDLQLRAYWRAGVSPNR